MVTTTARKVPLLRCRYYGAATIGTLQAATMVGSYHGDDDACSTMTDVRLRKKLAPLDRMDRTRETEYITNVAQL